MKDSFNYHKKSRFASRNTLESITIDGETKTVKEWSEHPQCQAARRTIYDRVKRKDWTPYEVVFYPVFPGGISKKDTHDGSGPTIAELSSVLSMRW